jgi:MinD superfamily P-loop ATPase containing an inserted ferredoxin domain
MTDFERFLQRFRVPEEGLPVIDRLVRPEEIAFLAALPAEHFTIPEAADALQKSTGKTPAPEQTDAFLREEYRRGLTLLEDEIGTGYRIAEFSTRLDIVVTTEQESYFMLPAEARAALDRWYFQKYLDGLGGDTRPTGDKVVPLEQALKTIDAADGQIWLQNCDCRPLAGNCGKPTDTCISFRSGINTMAHRGLSQPISKEEAKDVVRRANKAGLMQTVSDHGMCNCCGDCCYLFRAQKARGCGPVWPAAELIAEFRPEACISCRRCVGRCNFGAFAFEDGRIRYDPQQCRGCSLCAQTCPAKAITMARRA